MRYKISKRFFRAVENKVCAIRDNGGDYDMRIQYFRRAQKMLSRALTRRSDLSDDASDIRVAFSDRNIRAFAVLLDNASKNLEPVLEERTFGHYLR